MANKQNLQPLLDVRQHQLDLIFSASDSLDNKALAILGFDAAVLIFILQSLSDASWWWRGGLCLLFMASLVVTIYVMWPRDYKGASVKLEDHPEYLNKTEDELVLQLLSDTEASITHNTHLNIAKSRYCTKAISLTLLGLVVLVLCILKA